MRLKLTIWNRTGFQSYSFTTNFKSKSVSSKMLYPKSSQTRFGVWNKKHAIWEGKFLSLTRKSISKIHKSQPTKNKNNRIGWTKFVWNENLQGWSQNSKKDANKKFKRLKNNTSSFWLSKSLNLAKRSTHLTLCIRMAVYHTRPKLSNCKSDAGKWQRSTWTWSLTSRT